MQLEREKEKKHAFTITFLTVALHASITRDPAHAYHTLSYSQKVGEKKFFIYFLRQKDRF